MTENLEFFNSHELYIFIDHSTDAVNLQPAARLVHENVNLTYAASDGDIQTGLRAF